MSQVKFETTYKGKPVEVMAGWDNPMQHFYLTVFDLDGDADEETVWDTLMHPDNRDGTGTERLDAQLATMSINVPEGFWEKVRLKEGNRMHVHMGDAWHTRSPT